MKSKKWLISLGLAVVLVVAFALPSCGGGGDESGWYTPEGDLISFDINTISGVFGDIGLMVASDLQDFGLDVEEQVLDATTFLDYLYLPNLGEMQVAIYSEEPSPDPWGDWIWTLLADPEGLGEWWNPTWYDDERYNELIHLMPVAPNLTAKREILYEMQELLSEDLPMLYLVRPTILTAYRTDNWENWYNEIGGPETWLNEWSIREVTPVTNATRLNIGGLRSNSSINMEQSPLMYTDIGCLYLMFNYENLAFYPKVGPDELEANPDAAYEFVPKLATAYDVTYEDDETGGQNQVWAWTLRQGVKWHDYDTEGINFTSEDVVYTCKYVLNLQGASAPINWTAVEANAGEILPEHILVEADGDYTATMTYIQGYHQPEDYIPNWILWDAIVPKHVFEPDERDPSEWDGNSIGTGPFHLVEFEPGEYWLFERFDDYWGDLPAVEELLHQRYGDSGPLFLALEAGDIDVVEAESVPIAKVPQYEANPDIVVEEMPGLRIIYMAFNLHPDEGYAVLKDQVFRQAIAYAIDKEEILDLVYQGYGEIPDGWCYRESGMHNPDLPQYEYNPNTARDMLLAAGYTYVE